MKKIYVECPNCGHDISVELGEHDNQIRAKVIEEFVNWLGKELATIHLFPEQRAKLYADILIKSKELKEQNK